MPVCSIRGSVKLEAVSTTREGGRLALANQRSKPAPLVSTRFARW